MVEEEAKIEGDTAPVNTTKKKTPLTVEERKQVVAQLMIECTWVDDAPKIDKKLFRAWLMISINMLL
jgi:hypothetical protein